MCIHWSTFKKKVRMKRNSQCTRVFGRQWSNYRLVYFVDESLHILSRNVKKIDYSFKELYEPETKINLTMQGVGKHKYQEANKIELNLNAYF